MSSPIEKELESLGLSPQSLPEFLGDIQPLNRAERELLIDQALLLIEDVYVHLPLKRAMHAVDPVQRLRLLRHRLPYLGERRFHEELIETFVGLRDLHTNYILPNPYNRSTAVLPFLIGEFYRDDRRNYAVTHVQSGLKHATFALGVVVTHWNGVPIDRAVEINGNKQAGSNDAARHARGLERLTLRPLMMSLPPEEEWVDIRYVTPADGKAHEARFEWLVVTRPPPANSSVSERGELPDRKEDLGPYLSLGLDAETESARRLKKFLFTEATPAAEEAIEIFLTSGDAALDVHPAGSPDLSSRSAMPDVFSFRSFTTSLGEFGYVRIATFAVRSPDDFLREFVRIVGLLPKSGLILDVRGNGGGNILAGEKLLQTLTNELIEPERLHFVTTPLMLELTRALPSWFAKWTPSLRRSVTTGAVYSQGFPLEPNANYNKIGRSYAGRTVLLTDAFCYSTTDIFAAGFQDHGIGPVLGTAEATGAGGANVFTHDLLDYIFRQGSGANPTAPLPKGASFRVAIRRTTRVRENAGVPLEDLGVEPDHLHRPTLADLFNSDADLLKRAAELLRGDQVAGS